MQNGSGDGIIPVMYRMSIISRTEVTDNNLLLASFVLHMVELALLSLSIFPVAFLNFLLVDRRVFHVNVYCFLWNIMLCFYTQWTFRIGTFVITILRLVEDPSPFGPVGFLTYIREGALIGGVFTLFSIAVDRVISTICAEAYEESTSPRLSLILSAMSDILAVVVQVLRFIESISIMVPIGIACLLSSGSLWMLSYAYVQNRYYLRNPYSVNLNKKFQLRENIQVCVSLLPTLILSAIVGLIGACMLLAAFLLHVEVSVILIIGMFQCGLCLYCIACPISLIVGIQKYRIRTLALLRRRYSKVAQEHFKRPAEEERNLHFRQLERQWNRP